MATTMAQMLEVLASVASIVASFVGNKYVASSAVMSGLGVLPRAGPMRAFVLGASSKLGFLRPAFTASQRTAECEALKKSISARSSAQYIVVTGPKGVGKTTIIDTVASELPGVVRVDVAPDATQDKIVGDTLKAVTRFQFSFMDPFISGSTRVVNWHRRFFRVPPTVILHVGERKPGKEPAPMGSTVRTLVDTHKLRVIVDSSDSSLDKMALTTDRERVLSVGPMERGVLEGIPEFQDVLTALKTAGVADLVWGVLGGHPASYDLLKSDWVEAGSPGAEEKEAVVKVAETFMEEKLLKASLQLNEGKASHRDLVGPVYDQFKTVDELPANILETYVLPIPDKVLRLVAKKGQKKGVLVPTSPAMALVMRYGEGGDPPSLEVVRKALGMK